MNRVKIYSFINNYSWYAAFGCFQGYYNLDYTSLNLWLWTINIIMLVHLSQRSKIVIARFDASQRARKVMIEQEVMIIEQEKIIQSLKEIVLLLEERNE